MKRYFLKWLPFLLFLISIISIYRFAADRVWFKVEPDAVSFAGMRTICCDYATGKSLNGDIFIRNQDHDTQYLIDESKKRVYIIKDEGFSIDIGTIYTSEPLAKIDDPDIKTELTDGDFFIDDEHLEFTDEQGRRWSINR